jgi:outer membrane protein OmpA-like peptidoglycan-associated protein
MQVISAAAAAFKAGAPVTVQVTGYTDTSGSVPYNLRLSQRRAVHVARILNKMGVPPQAIAVAGAGEANLAVATPDGVREPRNRRVTIVE